MTLTSRARTALTLLFCSMLPWAAAQQSGQPGSSGSYSSTGNRQRSADGRPGSSSRSRQPVQRSLFITGMVLREDGTPPPSGVAIERVCGGLARREAYVKPTGGFSFQVGSYSNTSLLPDASEGFFGSPDPMMNPAPPRVGLSSPMGAGLTVELAGCELRARLAGYRSSSLVLGDMPPSGHVDVGTLILRPIEEVTGSTVSVTSLQAPKNARKALQRAEKASGRGKLDEAERQYQAAVDIFPGYAEAWFGLGLLCRQQARIDDARQALGKALEADRKFVKPRIELARLAAQEQNWEEVAAITNQAIALNPLDFPEGFYMNSLANYLLARLEASETSARRTVRLDGSHRYPQAHLLLALILRQRKDNGGEAEQLRYFLKYAPATANIELLRTRLATLESAGGNAANSELDPP